MIGLFVEVMPPNLILGVGLCECGCGGRTVVPSQNDRSHGVVKGQPRRFMRYHRRATVGYVIQESGCWEWIGARNDAGYGQFWLHGKMIGAHRFMYEQMHGPIPGGLVIDHLCRNPSCVRPDHLEVVTMRENALRGEAPAIVLYKSSRCKAGHPLDDAYVRNNGKRMCRRCRQRRSSEKYWRDAVYRERRKAYERTRRGNRTPDAPNECGAECGAERDNG